MNGLVRQFIIPFCILQLAAAGCNFSVDKRPGGGDIRPGQDLINKVSFQDVNKIFRMHCTGCHGNSGNVNLETHAQAKMNLERIRRSTIIERRMPQAPYPPLNQEQLTTLAAWIEAGGPEHPLDGGGPVEEPEKLIPTFESIKSLVLQPKCVVCHAPGKKAENIPLLTKSDLLDSPYDLVLPGKADESGLILVLKEDARKKMPPLDSGISPVPRDEVDVIKEWINNGASD